MIVFIVPSTVLGALHIISVLIPPRLYNYALLAPSTDEKVKTHKF